jgi:gamma-glutamyl-gamma-aminobutyrate hydrolase PuuD
MRPLVGITTYVTPARWSYWELEAALIPADYDDAVERAGGRPLLVPPTTEGVEETLDALDGIVFTGGSDLDPALYGEEPHPETFGVHRRRDDAELALLRRALERDMPVLGICRGIQVLNVGLGGDLHQHLPDVVGHEEHKNDPPGQFRQHEVTIEPNTRLAQVLGERTRVMSHHHQGLRRIGAGLVQAAHAEDGAVEAIEAPDKRFAVGVLWHPEAGADPAIFEAFVAEARTYAGERGPATERRAS